MAAQQNDKARVVAAMGAPVQKNTTQQAVAAPQASAPKEMAKSVKHVSCDMIAHRAYEIWRKDGGSDMENWLKAEREIRSQNMATI